MTDIFDDYLTEEFGSLALQLSTIDEEERGKVPFFDHADLLLLVTHFNRTHTSTSPPVLTSRHFAHTTPPFTTSVTSAFLTYGRTALASPMPKYHAPIVLTTPLPQYFRTTQKSSSSLSTFIPPQTYPPINAQYTANPAVASFPLLHDTINIEESNSPKTSSHNVNTEQITPTLVPPEPPGRTRAIFIFNVPLQHTFNNICVRQLPEFSRSYLDRQNFVRPYGCIRHSRKRSTISHSMQGCQCHIYICGS